MAYEYEIDGVTYIQKPLVLGQLKQLLSLLQRLRIPADTDALGVIMAIGADLPDVLAVVLTEKGIRRATRTWPRWPTELRSPLRWIRPYRWWRIFSPATPSLLS